MPANESSLFERLNELAEEAESTVRELEAQKAGIDNEIKRLRRLVRAVEGPAEQKKPVPDKRYTAPSPESIVRVGEALIDVVGPLSDFDLRRAQEASGYASMKTPSGVVHYLRNNELGVSKIGKAPGRGNAPLFRVTDVSKLTDEIERAKATS